MFKEFYATMNDVLDDIIREFPDATADKAEELEQQLLLLKNMNDSCLEEWTRFEEKLALCRRKLHKDSEVPKVPVSPPPAPAKTEPARASEHFIRGQGYYMLGMFAHSIREFSNLVEHYPEYALGRAYLAMGYLRYGDLTEAYRQFQLLAPLAENGKLKAISYSVMGCIQLYGNNPDKAFEYFKLADQADSGCLEAGMWNKKLWPYRREAP